MSRRQRAVKREIPADPQYGSTTVTKFVNNLMLDGKKSVAERIFYDAMRVIEEFDWLRPVLPLVRHHHERYDGTGYPDGLSGEDIPLGARIIGVAETFDVLTSATPWRQPLSREEAVAEVRRCSGAQFDPEVVEAFCLVEPLIQPLGHS